MTLRVESEIGRLRRVLVHRPGVEIDWMVPAMMERLLFDDILDSRQARREHDTFCQVLRRAGVETLDPQTLLAEVLTGDAARAEALEALDRDYGLPEALRPRLAEMPPEELARALVCGVRSEGYPLVGKRRRLFDLDPLPNYFFQRDPQVVLGDRVILGAMATKAREREPFIARLIFCHHPALAGAVEIYDLDAAPSEAPDYEVDYPYPNLEGGDVLIPSPRVVLVGVSSRTNMQGAEVLAEHLRAATDFEHLILAQLPAKRSYMHLDTVFTFIDRGTCLGFPPVVEPGRAESARVYAVDLLSPHVSLAPQPSLQHALAGVGLPVEIVPCGGADDVLAQQREQWTDGANAFAIAPGVIALYRRNRETVAELARRGWRVLRDDELLDSDVDPLEGGLTVITLRDNELSRARGGPRCMTMPLERDAVS